MRVRYQMPDLNEPLDAGRYVPSLEDMVRISEPGDLGTDVTAELRGMEIEELQAEDLMLAEIGRQWKIDGFQAIEPES